MVEPQQQETSPWPVMITAAGRSIPLDHVLKIDTSALESHKTLLVHTTVGVEMFHDEVALDLARAFGLRAAKEVASSQQPVASGGKRRKS